MPAAVARVPGGSAGSLHRHFRLAGAGSICPASVNSTPLGRLHSLAARVGIDRFPGRRAGLGRTGRSGRLVAAVRSGGLIGGYRRLLTAEAGHLVAALAMAGVGRRHSRGGRLCRGLLLPAQTWVLAAADSYAHFATLPIGLWTLAALIELAERSLPTASLAETQHRRTSHRPESAGVPSKRSATPPVPRGRALVIRVRAQSNPAGNRIVGFDSLGQDLEVRPQ